METQTAALHREGRIWRGLLLLLLETGSRKGFTTAPCWGWRAGGIGRVAPVIGLPTHFQVGPHRLIAQRDTGLRNSFPSSAGVRAGAGAGGTRRREGFSFLALAAHRPGCRGASLFSSLMRGVVCSAQGHAPCRFLQHLGAARFLQLSRGQGSCSQKLEMAQDGPARVAASWPLPVAPLLGTGAGAATVETRQDSPPPGGCGPLSSLRPEPPRKCVCIWVHFCSSGVPLRALHLCSYSPVLFPKN